MISFPRRLKLQHAFLIVAVAFLVGSYWVSQAVNKTVTQAPLIKTHTTQSHTIIIPTIPAIPEVVARFSKLLDDRAEEFRRNVSIMTTDVFGPRQECRHGVLIDHKQLSRVKWASSILPEDYRTIDGFQDYVHSQISQDSIKLEGVGNVTALIRMGSTKLQQWLEFCAPVLVQGRTCKKNPVELIIISWWDKSHPAPVFDDDQISFTDATGKTFTQRVFVHSPDESGMGYRFDIPEELLTTQFVLSLDDDMCPSHCSDVRRTVEFLKLFPSSVIGIDKYSRGLYEHGSVKHDKCSILEYKGQVRNHDSFYLSSNALSSRLYYKFYRETFPRVILDEFSRIKSCEDIGFSWFQAVVQENQQQFLTEQSLFGVNGKFLPALHAIQKGTDCRLNKKALSCSRKSLEKRARCLNFLLAFWSRFRLYPRVPLGFNKTN